MQEEFTLVAYPHPFAAQRFVTRHHAGITVREAIELARPDIHSGIAAVVTVNGMDVRPDDRVFAGDVVVIHFAPAGIETIAVYAVAAFIIGLFGFNVYQWILSLQRWLNPEDPVKGGRFALTGGSNKANPWGQVPVVHGKMYVEPVYAALPYTEYAGVDGADAYLRMLFVVGYRRLDITDIKIGDNLLATNAAGTVSGDVVADGIYANAQIELWQAGSMNSIYPYAVIEDAVNIPITRRSGTANLVMSASAKTVTIPIGAIVEGGQLRWDDYYKVTVGDIILFQGWANSGNNHEFEITDMSDDGTVITLGAATGLVAETKSVFFVACTNHVQPVAKKTTSLDVVITFPGGLGKYNSQQMLAIDWTVGVEARYRLKDSGTEFYSCPLVGYFNAGSNIITRHRQGILRFTATLAGLDPTLEYEILVRRTMDSAGESSAVDAIEWTCVRRHTDIESVEESLRYKVCLLAIRMRATAGMQGKIPVVSCIAEANYERTAATGTEATIRAMARNPAAAYVSALMDVPNPRPRTAAQIDWAPLYEWALWCQTAGHECNGIITQGAKLSDALARIAASGRAVPGDRNGLASVVADIPRTSVVQVVTPRNSRDFRGDIAWPETIHGLRIMFVNAENDYQQDERFVLDDGYKFDTEGDGILRDAWGIDRTDDITYDAATRFEKIELPFATLPDQVFSDGRYLLAARRLRPMTMSASMDVEHLAMTRGDRIIVQHDSVLWGEATGRIVGFASADDLYPATTMYPSETLFPGGTVLSVVLDEAVTMVSGSSYQARIRRPGSITTYALTTVAGTSKTLVLATAWTGVPPAAVGDLVMVGVAGLVATDCIVTGIEPEADQGARVSFVEYAPAVFSADSGAIPPYSPRIAPRARATDPVVVNTTEPTTGEAAMGGVEAIPLTAPRYRGRYADAHPETRNSGDWWTLYRTEGTGLPAYPADDLYPAEDSYPPLTCGIYWDDDGYIIQIDMAESMDEETRAKVGATLADVAWIEAQGYQSAADFGLVWMFDAIGSSPDLSNSVFAQNLYVGNTLRSGDYATDGSVTTGGKGFFLDSTGVVRGRQCEFVDGVFSGTITADAGVFRGQLDSPLLGTGQAIPETVITLPTGTHWYGNELHAAMSNYSYYWKGSVDTWSSPGYWDPHYTASKKADYIQFVMSSTTYPDIYTYTKEIYKTEYYSIEFDVDLWAIVGGSYIYESYDKDSFTKYWLGSALVTALGWDSIPQGVTLTASGTIASKTVAAVSYTATEVVFTFSDATSLTLYSGSYYSYSGSFTIDEQGEQTLIVKGPTYDPDEDPPDLGTVYAENTVIDADSNEFAGQPWKTLVLQGTAPASGGWTFSHGITNAYAGHRVLSATFCLFGGGSSADRFMAKDGSNHPYMDISDTQMTVYNFHAGATHRFVITYV